MIGNKIKVYAFTLAEILITLGVVGVIAALTIPAIINNYLENELKNQFKKTYATYSNAFLSIKKDLGYVPECYLNFSGIAHNSECNLFNEALRQNLNIVKSCPYNGYSQGCISTFTGAYDLGISGLNSYYSTTFLRNSVPSIRLADGTWLISVSAWNSNGNYVVDVNGNKGPNRWGYDIFQFNIRSDGEAIILYGNIKESGGRSFTQMLKYSFE